MVGAYPEWGRAGLLMTNPPTSWTAFAMRAPGREILGGTRPGDLPIEQASKLTFVINLKTAKALGITVPPALLSLADEVIE
jgi:putative ABC transport system substrate-binding protein